MSRGILERLADGPVLGDGGYLLELEKRGLRPGRAVHARGGGRASGGARAASPGVPPSRRRGAPDDDLLRQRRQARDGGMEGTVDEINRNAVRIAREVASEGDALVAGNLSPHVATIPREAGSPDHVRGLFDRQLQDQIDAGPPDFWIGETFSFLGEALLFVERAKATGLPVMVTMSFESAAREGVRGRPARRRRGGAGRRRRRHRRRELPERPEQRFRSAREMVEPSGAPAPVASQPSPTPRPTRSRTSRPGDAFPFALTPMTLARGELARFADARDGDRLLGSCCGAVAEHVRAMAKVLGKLPEQEREWRSTPGRRCRPTSITTTRNRGVTPQRILPAHRSPSGAGRWAPSPAALLRTSRSAAPRELEGLAERERLSTGAGTATAPRRWWRRRGAGGAGARRVSPGSLRLPRPPPSRRSPTRRSSSIATSCRCVEPEEPRRTRRASTTSAAAAKGSRRSRNTLVVGGDHLGQEPAAENTPTAPSTIKSSGSARGRRPER